MAAGEEGRARLEPVSDLAAIREEWTALAIRAGNLFGTWEWVTTWWEHFGAGREPAVGMVRDRNGRALGVVALYVSDEWPVRTLRFMGNGLSDRLHPVCAPEDRGDVAAALRAALDDGAWGWEALFAEDMPADEGWAGLVGGREWGRIGDPVLRVREGGWEGYLARRTSHFRSDLRYRENKLRRAGAAFRLCDDGGRLDEDFATLCSLHELRFGAGSTVLAGANRAFHRAFAEIAHERGWLRLWMLEHEGRPAAAWWGFRYGGAEWHYNGGRDPSLGRAADGHTLLVHSIREALGDGVGEYRFLRGGYDQKARLATHDAGLRSLARARGPRGRALLAATAVAPRAAALPGRPGRAAATLGQWSAVSRA